MSALGLSPTFKDSMGWRKWRATWKKLYKQLASEIHSEKQTMNDAQRSAPLAETTKEAQQNLHFKRVLANKMMGLLKEAKERIARIRTMQQDIAKQNMAFPMVLADCSVVDFHFNKGSIEFPDILPAWTIKAKGNTYYLTSLDFDTVSFSTKEIANNSTKGMLRFRHVDLFMNRDGTGEIRQSVEWKVLKPAAQSTETV